MSASVSRHLFRPQGLGRLWWLPSNGHGNGLDDAAWAPIADVSASLVAPLLAAFRASGVITRRHGRGTRASPSLISQTRHRTHTAPAEETYHICVGTSGHACAEEVVRIALPRLQRQAEA
jgi:hypothetical protein